MALLLVSDTYAHYTSALRLSLNMSFSVFLSEMKSSGKENH